ncbi:MAG: transketolase C-terminal domain-containing protein, partial [Bacillota bacterium]
NPAMVIMDGLLGQMMEPVVLKEYSDLQIPAKPWATTGMAAGGPQRIINSLGLVPEELEKTNQKLQAKYKRIAANEVRYVEDSVDDADLVLVAYGTSARIAKSAMARARQEGEKVGLLRPITLWPFPSQRLLELAQAGKRFLAVEMSAGQMVEDVKLAVNGQAQVDFYGRLNGAIPSVNEAYAAIMKILTAGEVS